MNLIPGALWRPIDVGNRPHRRKGRAVVGHIAVSNSPLLVPGGTPASRSSDWHLYLPKAGGIVQFIDLDLQAWATLDGNGSVIAWESEGGVGEDVNGEWTDGQLEAGAHVLAYANETEGTPLEVMADSRPDSCGQGHHGLGIDPWRVPGGELWSSSRGKACPGPFRKLQVPVIVGRARELRHGSAGSLPVVTPPPAPARDHPPVLSWSLPAGHYVGDRLGPDQSVGAARNPRTGSWNYPHPLVQNVQQWLIYHGCVPGQSNWRSGWADGLFDAPWSTQALRRWHERFYQGQPFPEQCWADDYARLAQP